MEFDQKQHYQTTAEQHELSKVFHDSQETGEVAPGVAVVRSNTPKPLTFAPTTFSGEQHEPLSLPGFPSKAPSAPPLPEELGEGEEENVASPIGALPLSSKAKAMIQDPQEFAWLFEYGLEMDSTILNSPERLDGLALLYGPAVLKGYSLMCGNNGGKSVATIVADSEPGAEVWGVLYRIPRRLTERNGNQAAQLDSIHSAIGAQSLFHVTRVVVQETYREREIPCMTYVMTENMRHQLQLHKPDPAGVDALFMQRLISITRKQKLPESYLSSQIAPTQAESAMQAPVRAEQNTEPLRILQEQSAKEARQGLLSIATPVEKTPDVLIMPRNRWLVIFAIYLVVLLMLMLTFAVLQGLGFGSELLTTHFSPLSVPWQVLAYGLMGGCISSIVTLGRFRADNPPLFVIITWFTRPYIGIVLAIFTYLFLTSGLFFFGAGGERQDTAFLLAGALAGLCEGCIFLKKKHS